VICRSGIENYNLSSVILEKKMVSYLCRWLVVVFASTQLTGCFTTAYLIDRHVNGTHCVLPTTKVGDVITEGMSGEKFVVVKLNPSEDGKPSFSCGARLSVRAKLEPLEKKPD
jgi:hypothetical protein